MSFALSKKNTSVVQNSKPEAYTVHFFEKKVTDKNKLVPFRGYFVVAFRRFQGHIGSAIK